MRILITNDDGYLAPGIQCLRKILLELGHEVALIAPHEDNSAISHSISLGKEILVKRHGDDIYSLTGTPADSIVVAMNAGLIDKPDLVISGINKGGNMGEDVHYSGTVAAAVEAAFAGYYSMAVSLSSRVHGDYMAISPFMKELIERALRSKPGTFLNVNYDPTKPIKGVKETRLGSRTYMDHFEISKWEDDTARAILKPAENIPDLREGTDYYALNEGYISVTLLSTDWTEADSDEGR
ncbi:5'/3'-nucleotidase SurE [Candidatus Calescamantes bacterium]|nr:5'/3'-nucleotidase SurE [Candidatus Calescamantes bacterium]MCK5599020.1 5'/3'-nucleotidase SurE [bacterium]